MLFHFSEDPAILRFEPHVPRTSPEAAPAVWAIDRWHAPLYYFPRQCPRILLWALPTTTPDDRERWFGDSSARMLAYIEERWVERMHAARLWRYTFDPAPFRSLHDAGMHVSEVPIVPLNPPESVGDLEGGLRADFVELRTLPDLTPLRGVWNTTLHASGIRLRNAIGFAAV